MACVTSGEVGAGVVVVALVRAAGSSGLRVDENFRLGRGEVTSRMSDSFPAPISLPRCRIALDLVCEWRARKS